jgi:3-dehydroquinate synthetase
VADRAGDLIDLMRRDKKAAATGPALVLVRGIGRAFLMRDVDSDLIADFLRRAA